MFKPENLSDIEQMIKDQVQESIHLDYKDARAVNKKSRDEFAKDVSAFANADGGVIVYGVREIDNLPQEIDQGVDDLEISREWIESAIITGISPRLDDVRIKAIPVSSGRSLYIVSIPKSYRGPHQSSDKKYYKRHNYKSVPMEDYEITDVRNRRKNYSPLISFEVSFYRDIITVFDVSNVGNVVVENIEFEFSKTLPWPNNSLMPLPFSKGISRFAPKQSLRFRYFTTHELLNDISKPTEFSVRISYFHPELNTRISDEWPVNFEIYRNTLIRRPEIQAELKEIVEGLKNLNKTVISLHKTLGHISDIAGATGLNISVNTLRNINHLQNGKDIEPIDPVGQEPAVFQEILGINFEMALKLYNALSCNPNPCRLEEIPGMTPHLLEKIRNYFILTSTSDKQE